MGLSRGTLTVSIMTVQLNLLSQQETLREKGERAELLGAGVGAGPQIRLAQRTDSTNSGTFLARYIDSRQRP